MKKIILVAVFLLCSVVAGHANVLTFEDLPGDMSAVPSGYGGFIWNSQTTVGNITKSTYPGSGYDNGTIGNVSVFNYGGGSPTDIILAGTGTFTFNSAQFTSAWYDQSLQFFGYTSGTLVDTSSVFNITTTVPIEITLNWSGIDTLRITNTNYQWDMDNFTYNSLSVPEPTTMILLGLGLAGLSGLRRRCSN